MDIYVSKQDNYKDYSKSSPRLVGEGFILTLDATATAIIPGDKNMFVSGGVSDWFRVDIQTSSDLINETLFIKKLNSDPQEGAKSQSSVGKVKKDIVFVNNEPALMSLGAVDNIETPQSRNISDPVKSDFDKFDFTNAHVKYFKNNIYIALPNESLMLIYNLSKQFWEPPQVLPAGRLAIIGGDLYMHSNSVPETYKLFDGTNDNGNAIHAVAAFSYFGASNRDRLKNLDQWYSEGYLTANTVLSCDLLYDYLRARKEIGRASGRERG